MRSREGALEKCPPLSSFRPASRRAAQAGRLCYPGWQYVTFVRTFPSNPESKSIDYN